MLAAGFAEPVAESQRTFRSVLGAVSRPGTVVTLPLPLGLPSGLAPASAAVALTLFDFETTVWLGAGLSSRREVADFMRFHTGTRIVTEPAAAAFALIDLTEEPLQLANFCQGDPAYPDRSTTVIAQVGAITAGEGLRLEGPGIAHQERLAFNPFPIAFLSQWASNRRRFPLGIDLLLTCDRHVAALPRTVQITEGSA